MVQPLISVVIPAWNRARLIGDTIASIGAPTPGTVEVVVIDDGSTDGTAEAAEAALRAAGLPGRVERQANAGPGAARNRGAAVARGRWLAFLDSDDLWLPWTADMLARALGALDAPTLVFLQGRDFADPQELAAVSSGALELERHDRFLEAVAATAQAGRALRFASSHVIPRESFLALGGMTGDVRCSEDSDLFLRSEAFCRCALVLAPVMFGYRTNSGDNLSGDAAQVCAGFRYLDARDRAGAYPGGFGDPLRRWFVAGSAVYAARVALANGRPALAYAVLARHAPEILRRRGARKWITTALTPALSLLRPDKFQFRAREAKG